MYLDGDREWPTLAGTGSEDYVGTVWGIQNQYANLYQGTHLVDADKMQACFYRYHIPDPVYFKSDIRVTVQQIGFTSDHSATDPVYRTGAPIYNAGPGLLAKEKGSWGMFERQDDWSSVAYFYLNSPEDDLPAIDPPEQRMKDLPWEGPHFGDVH